MTLKRWLKKKAKKPADGDFLYVLSPVEVPEIVRDYFEDQAIKATRSGNTMDAERFQVIADALHEERFFSASF